MNYSVRFFAKQFSIRKQHLNCGNYLICSLLHFFATSYTTRQDLDIDKFKTGIAFGIAVYVFMLE